MTQQPVVRKERTSRTASLRMKMRPATWLWLPLLFVNASCGHSEPPEEEMPLDEEAKIAPIDPRFYTPVEGPKRCRGDKDCPEGALCHPGTHTCFAAYPLPRMIDVTLETKGSRVGGEDCPLVRVYFPSNSIDLVAEARRWLEYNARCINSVPRRRILLFSHSDAVGPAAPNRKLSRQRGEAVRAFLIENGVEAPIRVIARGEDEPLMRGSSERDYAFNRRVEIVAR